MSEIAYKSDRCGRCGHQNFIHWRGTGPFSWNGGGACDIVHCSCPGFIGAKVAIADPEKYMLELRAAMQSLYEASLRVPVWSGTSNDIRRTIDRIRDILKAAENP